VNMNNSQWSYSWMMNSGGTQLQVEYFKLAKLKQTTHPSQWTSDEYIN